VSKEIILEALRKEPLKAGNWIHYFPWEDSREAAKTCEVCAVGSILRSVISDPTLTDGASMAAITTNGDDDIEGIVYGFSTESELFGNLIGNKMARLSQYFEGLSYLAAGRTNKNKYELSRHQIYRIRRKLISYVEKNFPKNLVIDIDGATPKVGVKGINPVKEN